MSRVALIGENTVEYVNTLLDIWNDNDCAVLIDDRIPFETALQLMKEGEVQKCYVDYNVYESLSDDQRKALCFIPYKNTLQKATFLPYEVYEKFKPNYSDNEAVIIYSSGTTGKSKGIILSHYAINTNADSIIKYMNVNSKDSLYIARALSHSSTLTGELLVALKIKAKVLLAPTIVPPRYIIKNVKKNRISILCLSPTLLSMISDEIVKLHTDISMLKAIYVSGSILNDRLYKKSHDCIKGIPIFNVYGMSETGPRLSAQMADCCLSNSVGKPIENVQICIIKESGEEAQNKEIGVVHVKTPSIFLGYVSGNIKHIPLREGWFNTGDLGYYDENNELHIEGRIDDVIIINTHKVYPTEIENKILEIEGVYDCCVTKIELNNKEIIGCLCVGEKITEKEIKSILVRKLPPYEIPEKIIFVKDFPRTLSGKVSKNKTKKILFDHIESL